MLAVFDKRPKNTPLLHSWGLSWVFQASVWTVEVDARVVSLLSLVDALQSS